MSAFGEVGLALLTDRVDECAGEVGRQDGTSERDDVESRCQFVREGVLEEESVGTGPQGGAGGLVGVEGGEYQYPWGSLPVPSA